MRRPAFRRSSARVLRPGHASERDPEPPTPRGMGTGGRHDERRSSRSTNAGQTGGELANPLDAWGSGIPFCSEYLTWRATLKLHTFAIEPSPHAKSVVGAFQVPEDQGKPVEPGRQIVRPGARSGQVPSEAHRGGTGQCGEFISVEDAQQLWHLPFREWRLRERVVESLDEPCKPVRLWARLQECDSRVLADPRCRRLLCDPPEECKVESIDRFLSAQQSQGERSPEQPDRGIDETRTVQRRRDGRDLDGSHQPKCNREPGAVKRRPWPRRQSPVPSSRRSTPSSTATVVSGAACRPSWRMRSRDVARSLVTAWRCASTPARWSPQPLPTASKRRSPWAFAAEHPRRICRGWTGPG